MSGYSWDIHMKCCPDPSPRLWFVPPAGLGWATLPSCRASLHTQVLPVGQRSQGDKHNAVSYNQCYNQHMYSTPLPAPTAVTDIRVTHQGYKTHFSQRNIEDIGHIQARNSLKTENTLKPRKR